MLAFSLACVWTTIFALKVLALGGHVPMSTVDGGLEPMAVVYAMAAATFLWWLGAMCRSGGEDTRLRCTDLAGRAHAMGICAIVTGLAAGAMAPVEPAPGQGLCLLAALAVSAWLTGRQPHPNAAHPRHGRPA